MSEHNQGRSASEGSDLDWEAGLERLRGAYADHTIDECAYEFRRFSAWCERESLQALPASSETIARVVDHYFETCTARTVESRIWNLRRIHTALGLPDPTRADAVRLAYRRGARLNAHRRSISRSRQAHPLNAELRDRLLAACPDTLMGARDRALLRLGYDTLCRQSELVQLRAEDLELIPGGAGRVLVRRSKTDREGRGEYVYLSPAGLAEVQSWLSRTRIRSGPILRGVHFKTRIGRKALHPNLIVDCLRKLARQAGLPEDAVMKLSGHSMRVGAAQDLAMSGRTLPEIMRAGRWRSLDAAALYVREAPINIWSAMATGERADGPAGPLAPLSPLEAARSRR